MTVESGLTSTRRRACARDAGSAKWIPHQGIRELRSPTSLTRRSPPGFTATTAQSYTRSGRPTECCSRTCAKRPAPRSRNHQAAPRPRTRADTIDSASNRAGRGRFSLDDGRHTPGKHQSPRQTKGRFHEQRNHHARSHRASAPQRAAEGQPGPPPTTIAARADRPACPARRRRTRRARFAASARLHADDDRHAIADRGQRIRFGARQGDRRATQEQPIGRALEPRAGGDRQRLPPPRGTPTKATIRRAPRPHAGAASTRCGRQGTASARTSATRNRPGTNDRRRRVAGGRTDQRQPSGRARWPVGEGRPRSRTRRAPACQPADHAATRAHRRHPAGDALALAINAGGDRADQPPQPAGAPCSDARSPTVRPAREQRVLTAAA